MTNPRPDREAVERILAEAAARPQQHADAELEGIRLAILLEDSLSVVVTDEQIRRLPGLDADGVLGLLGADAGGG